jgi:hypothetical protein
MIVRKRRLEILEARTVLKQRLQSLVDEEQWLLEAAELNERGFAAPSVECDLVAVPPSQTQELTAAAGEAVTAASAGTDDQLAKAQQISALLM